MGAAEISQREKSQSRNSPRKDVAAMAKARDQKKTMTKKAGRRAHLNGTLSGRRTSTQRTSTQRTSEERATRRTRRTRRVARARDPATETMMRPKEGAPKMAKERDQKMAKERDQKMAKKAKERDPAKKAMTKKTAPRRTMKPKPAPRRSKQPRKVKKKKKKVAVTKIRMA